MFNCIVLIRLFNIALGIALFITLTIPSTVLAKFSNPEAKEMLKFPGVEMCKTSVPFSYIAEYIPEDAKKSPDNSIPILVCLHGSNGSAFAELRDWYLYARVHHFAIVALQWQVALNNYLPPEEVYDLVETQLKEEFVKYPALKKEQNAFCGFSRGATYIPAMALLEKKKANHYFSLFILNSGSWSPANPPAYMQELLTEAGAKPYHSQHFIAYYGLKDDTWDGRLVKYGRVLKANIESQGGHYDAYFEEADGDHASFVHSKDLIEKVLGIWIGED